MREPPRGRATAFLAQRGARAVEAGAVAREPVERPPVERLVMDPRRPDHVLRAAGRIRALARHADLLHTTAVSALLPRREREALTPPFSPP